jgi:phosphoserine phosphatase
MLQTIQALGLRTLLVSGGFVHFTDKLKPRLKLDFTRANTLEIVDGKLTGNVVGEIVNADVKARTVREVCEQIGADPSQAIVMGDGSNDLKMMAVAGLSVAFRAKPVVRAGQRGVQPCRLGWPAESVPALRGRFKMKRSGSG